MPAAARDFSLRAIAPRYTPDHRVYIERDGAVVSAFHDIPLYADDAKTVLNMVVEVPRWTNAKMETWEDPNVIHPETKAKGDNDPLDVCEIGEAVGYTGQIKQVKVLGVMALLDEGETDWKILAIDINDPLAPKLNDIEDVERHMPGLIRATNEWFRIYKIPDGKPENQFAFSGECKNRKYATEVVSEAAEAWERLITGKSDSNTISTLNTTIAYSPFRGHAPAIRGHQDLPPAPLDSAVHKWFYISGTTF
ncbi:Inorganic pyrophosphatase [Neolecta irregularis DAH-3]|uniref:inorganic diphosphatase n=1 Tax=Neolecta irregularis (strain DAH-3) TaxID=1198029 RepID=A0A1U7LJB8_NEOID|nr:Inorganic pyrophosphatase [Neolecta irregularis DAH-3]|eukprot:OLL22739.1 Inorganic pyrophosphatase [Neolecta irregularis DAH-3]